MRYTTFDIEFADAILPSICSISIIDWDEYGIISEYKTNINPDCEVIEFLKERHGLTEEHLKNCPTIQDIWIEIYDRLQNKIVFSHYANRNVRALESLASINYLNMPSFIYCCSASISRKLWPYFKNDTLPEISERLGINSIHYNAYEDAKSVGFIVQKAIEDTSSSNFYELFNYIGFTGGIVRDGHRKIFRAIKGREGFIAKIKEDNESFKEIDWIEAGKNYSSNENIISSSLFDF